MQEKLSVLAVFYMSAQGDADSVAGTYIPEAALITKFSHNLVDSGSPTTQTIDIQDDGTDIVTAQDVSTPAMATLTTPVRVAADSLLEIDVNLAGGSSPTLKGSVTLFGYWG